MKEDSRGNGSLGNSVVSVVNCDNQNARGEEAQSRTYRRDQLVCPHVNMDLP